MIWIRFSSQYNSASLAAHFPPLQVMKLASNSQALDNIISLHMGRRRQPAVERTKSEQRITSLYITTAVFTQGPGHGRALTIIDAIELAWPENEKYRTDDNLLKPYSIPAMQPRHWRQKAVLWSWQSTSIKVHHKPRRKREALEVRRELLSDGGLFCAPHWIARQLVKDVNE